MLATQRNGTPLRRRDPLVFRWSATDHPLPVRVIRAPGRRPAAPAGSDHQPFDFCGHIRRLCADIAARCPELWHIDVTRLLFAVTQARSGDPRGLQARVTPLRCRGGVLTRRRRGVDYQVQRHVVEGREILYLVTFCLPRFLDQTFDDKLVTLFHELYHLSPAFDGDLRRHPGRYRLHTHSQRDYDRHMADLARAYVHDGAAPPLYDFLRLNFAELQARHGSVVGVVVPRPKVVPVGAGLRLLQGGVA